MPSMPRKGPLSIQGGVQLRETPDAREAPALRFHVVNATDTTSSGSALVHPDSCAAWAPFMQPTCLATLEGGSDCVATVRADERVVPGCMQLDAAMQHSLHLCPGETYGFRVFTPPADAPFALTTLEAEVRLLNPHAAPRGLQVDERQLAQALTKQHLGRVLAVGQLLIVDWRGVPVVARITRTDTLDAAAQEEAVAYHCFRGQLLPDTAVLLEALPDGAAPGVAAAALGAAVSRLSLAHDSYPDAAGDSAKAEPAHGSAPLDSEAAGSGGGGCGGGCDSCFVRLVLTNRQPRSCQARSAAIVDVHTSDGEVFPVKRKLLRPCIALTSAVRSTEDQVISVAVDVDTLTFDRVLIFLEAQALGRPPPDYAVHLAEPLLAAARTLGLRSLEDVCAAKLGQARSRLRVYSFDEVKAANAAGGCWLILDGMVLDVTRWLGEHPGGSTIIPAQALNNECSRFFEVYHVSRESFLYIKELYIGELAPEELAEVPPASNEAPSADFLQQLREYTPFRLQPQAPKAFKSF